MSRGLSTILLLVCSNIFMTFAWYGNLKLQEMKVTTDWPLFLIILLSWGLALVDLVFKGEPIRWNHFVAFGFIILAIVFAFWKTE